MKTRNTVYKFSPVLRTEDQTWAFRVVLQTLGYLCGLGINCFDFDNAGYVKAATEVSTDNLALMRNMRRHEHALEGAIAGVCRALLAAERSLGAGPPDEGLVRVTFDGSVITDTTGEKRQDMDEATAGSWPAGSTAPSGTAKTRRRPRGHGKRSAGRRGRLEPKVAVASPSAALSGGGEVRRADGSRSGDGSKPSGRVPAVRVPDAACASPAPSCVRRTGDERTPRPTTDRG